MRLNNKVSLITGAGSGIGLSTARLFAANGSNLAISDISEYRLQSTIKILKDYGIETTSFVGDISNNKFTNELVNKTVQDLGKIDIVVNSAGITPRNALPNQATQEEVWDRVIDVNLKGTYLVSTHSVEKITKQENINQDIDIIKESKKATKDTKSKKIMVSKKEK